MMIVRLGVMGFLAAALIFALPLRAIAAGETVIVALGDSLTAGYGLPQDQSFPAQLQAALNARGANVRVVNAGVSGDTASAAAKRLDWALPENAAAVIVELGGNDALQGIPPAGTRQALAKIMEKVKAEVAGAARRHGGAAQYGQGVCGAIPRDLSGSRRAV